MINMMMIIIMSIIIITRIKYYLNWLNFLKHIYE